MDFANHPIEAVPKMIHEGTLSADNPILAVVESLLMGEYSHGDMPWSEFVGTMEAHHFQEIITLLRELGDLCSRDSFFVAVAYKICAMEAGAEADLLAEIPVLYAAAIREKGAPEDVLTALVTARDIYGEYNTEEARAVCDLGIAHIFLASDRPDEAIRYGEQARQYLASTEHSDKVARYYLANAQAFAQKGFASKAIDLFESARLLFERDGMISKVAECYQDMAYLYKELGDEEKAHQCSERSSRLLQVRDQQAVKLSGKKRSPDQECFFQKVASEMQEWNRLTQRIGEYLLREDDPRATCWNQLFFGPGFSEIMLRDPYHLVEIWLKEKKFEEALEALESFKGQTLKSMLRGKLEAADQPRDQALAILREKERNLNYRDIQALVEHEELPTALVYLFPMEDKTVVFIVRRGTKLSDYTVIIDDYTLGHLREHVFGLSERDSPERIEYFKEYLEHVLRQLHSKIFEPISLCLDGIQKIIFVPHSGFHLLPLHALYTDSGGQRSYLMDRYRISYAPSAGILAQCRATDRPLLVPKAVVALADPTNNLPAAEYEAHAIGSLFDAKYLPRASKTDILKEAVDADIFHYLGHADGRALLLCGEGGVGEERYETNDIFLSLNLTAGSLVTLSACKSGQVIPDKTDEYIGLPSAFLYAGASSVVCSLWSVEDYSTTLLMSKMYEYMKKGLGKAESLRKAQQWLKDQGKAEEHESMLRTLKSSCEWQRQVKKAAATRWIPVEDDDVPALEEDQEGLPEDFDHPYYWAGFIASGADQ